MDYSKEDRSMTVMKLKPSDLTLSDEVLPRQSKSRGGIDKYKAILRRFELPPLLVVYDGTVRWLADARSRLQAHVELGAEEVKCDVVKGTKEDAIWLAAAKHAMPRTNAEKRNAVELLLKTEKGQHSTNEQIADHVGCSAVFVSHVLDKKKAAAEAGKPLPPRVVEEVRGGKVVEVNVTNTGKAKKPRAGKPNKSQAAFRAQKAKKKHNKDGIGQEIPDFLQAVAYDSLRLVSFEERIIDLMDDLTKFRNMPTGPGAYLDTQQIMPLLQTARKLIADAQFHACCPDCLDRKAVAQSCPCKGVGWFGNVAYIKYHEARMTTPDKGPTRAARKPLAMALGRIIRNRREELHLSRREVAERLKIHLMTHVAREAGTCMVPTERLGEYSEVLGIPAVELLGRAMREAGKPLTTGRG